MASKAKAIKAAVKPKTAKSTKGTGIVAKAAKAVKSVVKGTGFSSIAKGLVGGSRGGAFKPKVSAKRLLKKAYERKAKAQIRIGNLGQARRLLRKKATVV